MPKGDDDDGSLPQTNRLSIASVNTRLQVVTGHLEILHSDLERVVTTQGQFSGRFDVLGELLERLNQHVIDGNGRPGLIHRVAVLETHRDDDRTTLNLAINRIENVSLRLEDLGEKFQSSLAERVQQIEQDRSDIIKAQHRVKIAAISAVATFMTAIVTVAGALLPWVISLFSPK